MKPTLDKNTQIKKQLNAEFQEALRVFEEEYLNTDWTGEVKGTATHEMFGKRYKIGISIKEEEMR